MPLLPPRPMPQEELEKYLEVIIKKLLENKPALGKDPKLVNELVQEGVKLIDEKFIDLPHEKNLKNLRDPNFVRQLALCLTLTAEIKGDKKLGETLNKALDKLIKDPKFIAEFRKISPKDIDANSKLDKLLDKFLNKEQKEMVKDALKKINGLLGKKFGKDKDGKQKDEAQPEDQYINLYGLVSSKVAGGLAVPVYVNLGTRDFLDQNPNGGYSQIARINDVSDTARDDSGGIVASAKDNFSRIAGDIISIQHVQGIQTSLDNEGLIPKTAPELRR